MRVGYFAGVGLAGKWSNYWNSSSDSNSKGISIAGASGEAIFAVSDGKVVYSGNGLRGYGNLVIIKHPMNLLQLMLIIRVSLSKRVRPLIKVKKLLKWECLKRIPQTFV